MAGGGAVLCIFWYQVGVKYHPTPLGAVKKMMRSNAESLMAGAGAVDLYFDTESMQNIIQSLIGRYENGLHRYTHRVQWGESLLKTNGILCESFQIGD